MIRSLINMTISRLAHEYLSTMQGGDDEDDEDENSSDEEERHQNISQRLQRERLEKQGKYVR
jgi:Ran GTPase-activating protein (RanGAP) involved in mRNA processing and transport